MVDGLHPGGLSQGLVPEENRLGEAGGAGGVVDGRVILILDEHLRGLTGAVGGGGVVVLGKGGAVLSHKEEQAARDREGATSSTRPMNSGPKTRMSTSALSRQYAISREE